MEQIVELLKKELNLHLENNDNIYVKTFADGNTSGVIELVQNGQEYVCKYMKDNNVETIKLLFENEIYFYTHFYKNLSFINIPQPHHYYSDENNKFIVLKKIPNYVCELNNINTIKNICDEILKLHMFFFEKTYLLELNYPSNAENIIEQKINKNTQIYFNILKKYVNNNVYEKLKYLVDNINYKLVSSNRITIIHGALKYNNICFNKNEHKLIPYFIDWSLIREGYGVEDILYLLIFSLKHSDFKEYYLETLDYYYNLMNQWVIYEIDDFENDILISLKGFILTSVVSLFFIFHFTKKENNCLEILDNYLLILDYYENKLQNKKDNVSYDMVERLDILDFFKTNFLWYFIYFASSSLYIFLFLFLFFV